jgi:parallel beta-helix repeat protein
MISQNKIALLLLSATATAAFAQSDARRPLQFNSGSPAVISESGTYVLTRDIATRTGTALMITANNVTLDLNGFTIQGPGQQVGNGIVISGATGVRVTNGIIADFGFGVMVANSNNVTLRDLSIRAAGQPPIAPPPATGILIVQSKSVVVEDNNLYNVGLGIFVRGGRSWGNRIANNTIVAGSNGVFGICYNPTDSDPMAPRGDVISGNHIVNYGTGIQMAATSPNNMIRNNTIAATNTPIDNANTTNVVEGNSTAKLP